MSPDEFERKNAKRLFVYLYYRVGDSELANKMLIAVFTHMRQVLASPEEPTTPLVAQAYGYARQLVVDYLRGVRLDLP